MSAPSHPAPELADAPHECGERALATLIEGSAEPVVLESYFGGWERPWRALSREDWRALRRELAGHGRLVAAETGASRATAVRFGLEIVPAVLVFLGGEVVARFEGRVSAARVIEALRTARREQRERVSHCLELEAWTAAHAPDASVGSRVLRAGRARTAALG